MTHSKGPRNFHPSSSIVGSLIDNGDNNIAIAMPLSVKEECEANARLIAAAPDLLEALKEAYCWNRGHEAGTPAERGCKCETWHDAETMIAAAIAKAEGRS